MDILRGPQVTQVFQMLENESVTAVLPQHMADIFLCVSSGQVCSAITEADGKLPPFWSEKIGPKKGKHHRELLSRTIKTEERNVPPLKRFAKISSHIIN